MLICNYCGNKQFSDGKDMSGFTEVKLAPISARWDGKDKTTKSRSKKFKCSECGRLYKVVDLTPKDEDKENPKNFDFPYDK